MKIHNWNKQRLCAWRRIGGLSETPASGEAELWYAEFPLFFSETFCFQFCVWNRIPFIDRKPCPVWLGKQHPHRPSVRVQKSDISAGAAEAEWPGMPGNATSDPSLCSHFLWSSGCFFSCGSTWLACSILRDGTNETKGYGTNWKSCNSNPLSIAFIKQRADQCRDPRRDLPRE